MLCSFDLRRARALARLALLISLVCSTAAFAANPVAPTAYGAVGNGVADDSAAMQTALNTGKIVHLEGKNYRITQRLTVPAGGGILGPGTLSHDFNLTLAPAAPNGNDVLLYCLGDNCSFSDFKIRKVFTDGSYSNGLVSDQRKGLRVRNLDIFGYSARYGIHIIENTDFEVTGCYIRDFMVNTACDMLSDSPAGLRVTRSHRGVISNNRVYKIEVGPVGRASLSPQNAAYGPQGYQADSILLQECSGVTVSGNVLATSGTGIDLLLSNSCTVTGNFISNIWVGGIKMMGVGQCTVTGNYIAEAHHGISLSYHGSFTTEASGNVISGNVFRNLGSKGSFGILAADRVNYAGVGSAVDIHDANSRYNMVSDNVMLDTQTTKTMTAGVRNIGGATNVDTDNIYTTLITSPAGEPAMPN